MGSLNIREQIQNRKYYIVVYDTGPENSLGTLRQWKQQWEGKDRSFISTLYIFRNFFCLYEALFPSKTTVLNKSGQTYLHHGFFRYTNSLAIHLDAYIQAF